MYRDEGRNSLAPPPRRSDVARVVADIAANIDQRALVTNGALVIVALPESAGKNAPTEAYNTVPVASGGEGFEALDDVAERQRFECADAFGRDERRLDGRVADALGRDDGRWGGLPWPPA